ncbi:MAG: Sec-independent protein translocase protein TatB [Bdellovibrionales bacterium]|nr:Sec-independent protein translocase protein TatB [Bdellovibrionales bacterium]
MFNFGFLELMTLAVIGLIVLGPEQFPKVARGVLKVINELKRAFSEAKMDFDDIKVETEELLKKAEAEFSSTTQPFKDLKQNLSDQIKEQTEDSGKQENLSSVNQKEGSKKGEKHE